MVGFKRVADCTLGPLPVPDGSSYVHSRQTVWSRLDNWPPNPGRGGRGNSTLNRPTLSMARNRQSGALPE
eukprot:5797719-Alexandrium_andersonii.AAC.1